MRRLLRRWLELEKPRAAPAPPPEPPAVTRKQFDELSERVDYLAEAVNRLRGRVTGGLAHSPKAQEDTESRQDAPGAPIGGAPIASIEPDRWMALAEAKRARRAK